MDIDDLYEMIPEFICEEGCYECCRNFGVPSRTAVEDERLKKFLEEKNMHPGEACGHTCPYLDEALLEGGCSIYPVRPLICRLYGTSPSCLCNMHSISSLIKSPLPIFYIDGLLASNDVFP